MASSIDAVYMVEASRELRDAQKNLLCGPGAHSTESKAGYHSTSKYGDTPIVWTETIKSIPIGPCSSPPTACAQAYLPDVNRALKNALHRGT